jgi:hypothetical protein
LIIIGYIAWFGVAALSVSMGVAILKYRLYEIDRIISRTLAYAIVTGLLVGVYAGLVLLATRVLDVRGPVSVAAATLVAAALFAPVRRRVQHLVDRRFNRPGSTPSARWRRSRPGCRTRWILTRSVPTWPEPCTAPLSRLMSRSG